MSKDYEYSPILSDNFITCIDNRVSVDQIKCDVLLPACISEEIHSAETIRAYGFQEVLGYNGRTLLFSCGGCWNEEVFMVSSYGSNVWQWNTSDEVLHITAKVVPYAS